MTQFIFVRHAQSVFNVRPELIVGRSNHIALSEQGIAQAGLLGAYLTESALTFDAIFSSGATRADSTARIALRAANINQRFDVDERLLELSQGPWSGQERDQVYDVDTVIKYRLNDLDGSLPEAESIIEGQTRIREFVEENTLKHPDATLLIFSHGLLIRSLVADIQGFTKQELLNLDTPNGSMTCVVTTDDEWHVDYVGKTVIEE